MHSNESDSDYQNIAVTLKVPSNFPELVFNTNTNPLTNKGIELGKKIFYDGRLSSDGVVSCGFCHIQENAFIHHGHTFSHGVGEGIGTRNTPAIQNMAFQSQFMWDGASAHLDLMAILPITNPIEMNGDFNAITQMMRNDAVYKKLFSQAFSNKAINSENLLKALGQFMASMVSSNSRFDKYKRSEVGGTLTQEEQEGYALFNQKCSSCQATDLFTDNSFRNNGLPVNPSINDIGRFRVTELAEDLHKFKVPSLRNVEKTSPYMHDGRFFTLEAVLDHYSSGMINSPTLDASLNSNGNIGIPLTSSEKTKIIAFLKTLTDNQYLTDKRFSEF
ncbi:MAG: cytochrome c peroxidase [Flavobacterium sp.]|nr:cytochrome c peroxidase [Flavobacterium sp.]MDI1317524.1 cytochrome c peroxidase [Flavobacterium sp.]